jgi:hypothetical protein
MYFIAVHLLRRVCPLPVLMEEAKAAGRKSDGLRRRLTVKNCAEPDCPKS